MMVVARLTGALITKVSGLVGQYFSERSSSIEEKIKVGVGTVVQGDGDDVDEKGIEHGDKGGIKFEGVVI